MPAGRVKIKDDVILASLKKFYKLNNKEYFKVTQWDKWNDKACTSNCVIVHFGSWRKALKKAGVL